MFIFLEQVLNIGVYRFLKDICLHLVTFGANCNIMGWSSLAILNVKALELLMTPLGWGNFATVYLINIWGESWRHLQRGRRSILDSLCLHSAWGSRWCNTASSFLIIPLDIIIVIVIFNLTRFWVWNVAELLQFFWNQVMIVYQIFVVLKNFENVSWYFYLTKRLHYLIYVFDLRISYLRF